MYIKDNQIPHQHGHTNQRRAQGFGMGGGSSEFYFHVDHLNVYTLFALI